MSESTVPGPGAPGYESEAPVKVVTPPNTPPNTPPKTPAVPEVTEED